MKALLESVDAISKSGIPCGVKATRPGGFNVWIGAPSVGCYAMKFFKNEDSSSALSWVVEQRQKLFAGTEQ